MPDHSLGRAFGRLLAAIALVGCLVTVGTISGGIATADAFGCLNNCTTLTVSLTGDGQGEIATLTADHGSPNGLIDCSRAAGVTTGKCSFKYQNTYPPSTLTEYYRVSVPAGFNAYLDISHQCTASGAAKTCDSSISFSSNTTMTWQLTPINADPIEIIKQGLGSGTVTSSPGGINCGTACFFQYGDGSTLSITATPASGSQFGGWVGEPCEGEGSTCTFTVLSGYSIYVDFNPAAATPPPTATPKPSPSATPVPTAKPTSTPAPTPTAQTTASPTGAPTQTPRPGSTSTPGPTAGGGSGQPTVGPSTPDASSSDVAVGGSPAADTGSTPPTSGGPGPSSPSSSSGGADSGTLVIGIAIVVAGLAIGGGLALGWRGRRRSS